MTWLFILNYLLLISPIFALEPYNSFSAINFKKDAPSCFGYSITYEPFAKKLIVSAPLNSDIGDVFSCNINTQECGAAKKNISNEMNLLHHQRSWFGAAVKASTKYFVTCAPLHLGYSENVKNRTGVYSECFKCYTKTDKLDVLCDPIHTYTEDFVKGKFENNFITYGWSIDTIQKNIIMGGPAMGTGNVISYYTETNKNHVTRNMIDKSKIKFNFGYSVAIGYFSKKNSITYAISSTYGYGTVVIMDLSLNYLKTISKEADKYMVGSMYGATLCAASLTGDLRHNTDLLVGAPTFATDYENNIGAVYVYLKHKNIIPTYKRTIRGYQPNSYFGSAIVSVKDLNSDNIDEIAIGAPYEDDGRGVVYIYSGAMIVSSSESLAYIQRIVAEPDWTSFGASLTALQDYDDNGCYELAIGAPESGTVRLLRCMASIIIKLDPEFPSFQNESTSPNPYRNSTHFVFKSCFDVIYPKKPDVIQATIIVNTEIIHQDARLNNEKDATYEMLITKASTRYCKNITVYMPLDGNYNIQIGVKTSASLQNEDEMEFKPSHVILSDRSILNHYQSIWAAACSGKQKCMPNIKYLHTNVSIETPYLIGSTSNIAVSVYMENVGEIAYDACVIIEVKGAPIQLTPQTCDRDDTTPNLTVLKCSPKQILRNNSVWNIQNIILDTEYLTSENKEILIKGTIYNHCSEMTGGNSFNKVIELKHDEARGVFIAGSVGVDNIDSVEHNYEIINIGPTNWARTYLRMIVEKRHFFTLDDISLQIGTNTEYRFMENENSDFECNYEIEKITKMAPVPVVLRIKSKQIGTTNIGEAYTIISKLIVEFERNKKEKSLTSTLKAIPLEILLAALAIGIIIFVIIFFILKQAGCLRRKNKEQLKRVRMSVRRQTMMRESVMIRQNRSSDMNAQNREELRRIIQKRNAEKKDRRIKVSDEF